MSPQRRQRRGLTAEELRLWVEVASTARPLRGKAAPELAQEPISDTDKAPPGDRVPAKARPAGRPAAGPRARQEAPAEPPLAALERRFVQRLRRGKAEAEAVIDLHGLRQEEARQRLLAFLQRCQAQGMKAAIVITGKGGRADGDGGGVLRRAVPLWLALPELRGLVIGFTEAGAGLGGSGALILRIRAAARRGAGRLDRG